LDVFTFTKEAPLVVDSSQDIIVLLRIQALDTPN
jgi:hypothetical protein